MRDRRLLISQGGRRSHRIRLWPSPVAEVWGAHDEWYLFSPEFRVVGYPLPKTKPREKRESSQLELGLEIPVAQKKASPLTKREAYDQIRQTLPPSYGFALAPFKSHQWNMIAFLWRERRFYELIKGNPALAFMLANDREIKWGLDLKELRLADMTGMKQPKLLELLDLPPTRQIAQILRKIHPSSAHPGLRGQINYCLRDEETVKRLSHLKKINAGVLYLLASAEGMRSRVTPPLLEETSENKPNNHYPAAAHQLRECIRWHNQLRRNQRFPLLRSLEALGTYHDVLAAESARILDEARLREEAARAGVRADRLEQLRQLLDKPFPKPPIKGNGHIVPLRTAGDLIEEGRQQHNCVGGYAHRVRTGSCYIYRILKPERATLSITRSSGNQWSIEELNASCNSAASAATRQAVGSWLAMDQLGI